LAPQDISGKMKELFSNADEVHAFLIGLSESIFPAKPIFKMPMKYENPLEKEYHYYLVGRAIGFVCLLGIIISIVKLLGG